MLIWFIRINGETNVTNSNFYLEAKATVDKQPHSGHNSTIQFTYTPINLQLKRPNSEFLAPF